VHRDPGTSVRSAAVTLTPSSELRELEAAVRAERAAREELEAILAGVADAVIVHDAGGRLAFVNQAAVELLGYPDTASLLAADPAEVRGRFTFETADRRPFPLDDLPSRRVLRGEEPAPVVVRYRARGTGAERWSRIKARPLRGDDGQVRLAIAVIEDITEIKQAEYAQGFLAEASRVLGGSLDYGSTLARVAALAVPEIADWCAVDLVSGDGFERVSVQHVDPAKIELAHQLAERYPPEMREDRGVLKVVRSGESELYPEIPDELLAEAAVDDEHLALLRSLGMVSVMVVPIQVRGDVLGVITFVSAESARRFDPHDLALAEDLGLRAGTAIQNARLFRDRSAIAHTLQASLLPPELPEIEQLECAALFRAAGEEYDVGGDFYDVFSTADGEWFAVIGDVCGKGPEAAATTGLVRHTVRAAAVRRRSPAAILRWLNETMLRHDSDAGRFCTVAVVRLDAAADGVHVTSAVGGHPLARVVRGSGGVDQVGAPGTLVGVTPDVEFHEGTTVLAPGDALMLFTDGLTEAGAPDRVWSGEDVDAALDEARAASGGSLQRMIEQVAAAALGDLRADPRDDVALLALRAR
jgi:PAS domain S-box-containing protein